ncbi:hypothetical protein KAF44_15520 [Cupriavidus necator]|nr:hypothetical protein KAF44_15520 [Cupriavidus necator]
MRVLRGLVRLGALRRSLFAQQVELARVAGSRQLVKDGLDAQLRFLDLDIEQFAVGSHGLALAAQLRGFALQPGDLVAQPLVLRRQGVRMVQHAPDLGGQLFEFGEHRACHDGRSVRYRDSSRCAGLHNAEERVCDRPPGWKLQASAPKTPPEL